MSICSSHFAPVHADINLTRACNLQCSYCHLATGRKKQKELTSDELKSVIYDLVGLGCKSITFAGGEPFVRPDLPKIISYALSFSQLDQVSLVTNGTVAPKKGNGWSEFADDRLVVAVSIDAERLKMIHKPISSKGKWLTLLHRLDSFASLTANVSINYVLTEAGMDAFWEFYKSAEMARPDVGITLIGLVPPHVRSNSKDLFPPSLARWVSFLDIVFKKKQIGDLPNIQLSVSSPWQFYLPAIYLGFQPTEAERLMNFRCSTNAKWNSERGLGDSSGTASLAIDADGRVFPSILLVDNDASAVGSIRSEALREIWHGPGFAPFRSLSLSQIDGYCSQCPINKNCGAGSRVFALTGGMSIASGDPTCPLQQRFTRCETGVE
jgi:radical SAM protein with 4Fe4S-binding SPASM domain